MLTENKKNELRLFATQIRLETLQAFKHLGFGHVGGAMSIVETLAVLYGDIMKLNPNKPDWPDRDWLVLSKGHAGPSLYATLALKKFFPLEDLKTLNTPGTNLPSHCDRNKTIGVDMTTGSLGHGISTAIGVALGNRLDGRSSHVYLILGDGECNEGQVWEGAMFAAHYRVDNLVAFIDYNKQQLDGFTCDIMDLGNLSHKFASFGWHVQDIDGHDITALYEAIENAKAHKGQPSVIILNTSKGKGCCFAEGVLDNHHMTFSEEALNEAIECVKNELCSFADSLTKQHGVVK
jgi:transketolase